MHAFMLIQCTNTMWYKHTIPPPPPPLSLHSRMATVSIKAKKAGSTGGVKLLPTSPPAVSKPAAKAASKKPSAETTKEMRQEEEQNKVGEMSSHEYKDYVPHTK